MLTLRTGPAAGLTAQAVLLVALEMVVGLSAFGWLVGIGCAVVVNAAVVVGLARSGGSVLGPANAVTLTRATLSCGVAALVADSFLGIPAVAALVALSTVALVLDATDGWVARRTRTASRFGARFDGEVDAFLILVLSVYVAPAFGGWVLAIGLARYAFAAAGWVLPWLRGQLPPRYWRKVVAAVQGIVLTIAAADVLSRSVVYVALVVALAMLTESFGRDVWWRWRHGSAEGHAAAARPQTEPVQDTEHVRTDEPLVEPQSSAPRPRWRSAVTVLTNLLALLLVWFALVAPNQAHRLTPGAFLRIPAEGLLLAALALVLPRPGRRIMVALVGLLLGLLTIVRLLDMGFFAAFDRPFNLVTDRGYFPGAVELVREQVGTLGADIAVVLAAVLVLALLLCLPLALARLTGLLVAHRRWSIRAVTGVMVVWLVCSLTGLQIQTGQPVASLEAGHLALGQVRAITDGVRDQERFDAAAAVDDFRGAADSELLTGLRGKDVLLVFVESYGRVALEGPQASAPVRAVLDAGTDRLSAAGYATKSAFLTSPTFGGLSWLAHSTLQSGLWVDNQPRYDRLIASNRMTLTRAFDRAGWRTVAVLPSNREKWPEGKAFYQLDKIYGRRNTGYAGPRWGFSRMPDQYALAAFQRLELAAPDRRPVMAEVDLASSHAPWAPVPRMVDWNALGDGTMFNRIHDQSESAKELWRDHGDVPGAYAGSIAYSLQALISFVQHYGDDDLVMVLLGDHQPAPIVSGHGASHDVPITVVAHDPSVIDRISGWGWQDGMRPDPQAPVWRMDAFRDRFLAAYSPELSQSAARPGSP